MNPLIEIRYYPTYQKGETRFSDLIVNPKLLDKRCLQNVIDVNQSYLTTMSVLVISAFCTTPKKIYINELKEFQYTSALASEQEIIKESDIYSLPDPVQRYLNYTGFVGAPKSIVTEVLWAESKIRFSPDKNWIPLSTKQYIFSSSATRIAYMHTRIAGVMPFEGRDRYHDGSGHMYGKLAKVFTVFNNRSQEIALGGAVILLAEALLEPTIALQKYIIWESVDVNTAKATLRNGSLEVSGRFFFNDIGEYIRFESDDRPYDLGKEKYETKPFSINLENYIETDGFKLPSKVTATWHLEEGDFTYWDGQIAGLRRNISPTLSTN